MTQQEELKLIEHDDSRFTATKIYLRPFVVEMIRRRELPEARTRELFVAILGDVPRAAKHFVKHARAGAKYRLHTYFSWYVVARIRDYLSKRRAA